MRSAWLVGVVLMSCVGIGYAQQVATGTYSGSVTGDKRATGVNLDIKSVENGKIQASVTRYGRCGGTTAVEGTYQDGKIQLQSAAQRGPAGDCGELKLELVLNGNKLTGRFMGDRGEWREIQFSK